MTKREASNLRIGAVSYLNSKPLIEDLPALLPDADLLLDYPSRLAEDLAAGEIDVGLIPSVECLRNTDYRIVSDACVATRGPVLSVKLFSRVPTSKIRRLALDEGSRTSVVLVQLLLAERFQLKPQLEPLPLGQSVDSTNADAILLIGDRAIHPPPGEFAATWDLGEEWTRETGLPFVFAVWAARRTVDVSLVEPGLSAARNRGLERLRDIAARECGPLGISEQAAYDYLSRNLYFRLGPEERRGFELFEELAVKQGLIEPAGTSSIHDAACGLAEKP